MERNKKALKMQGFLREIVRNYARAKKLKPDKVYVFNVIANYGSYQIKIDHEYSEKECRKFHFEPHSRKIEITGSMHHLFINPKRVAPIPQREDIRANLKGSIIMKDIIIHIIDDSGNGDTVKIERPDVDGVHERQRINLAGENGDALIEKFRTSGRLNNEAYKIIQEDILKALKHE